MNSTTKTADVVALVLEFVELQTHLILAFRQTFPQITDWENLLDCPRAGCFRAQGEEWNFQRHGVGICFTRQNIGTVVDAHVLLDSEPRAFDEWRLSQYFESIGIEKLDYLSNVFEVCDEDGTAELMNCLLKDSLIAIVKTSPSAIGLAHRKLYTLKTSRLGGE